MYYVGSGILASHLLSFFTLGTPPLLSLQQQETIISSCVVVVCWPYIKIMKAHRPLSPFYRKQVSMDVIRLESPRSSTQRARLTALKKLISPMLDMS